MKSTLNLSLSLSTYFFNYNKYNNFVLFLVVVLILYFFSLLFCCCCCLFNFHFNSYFFFIFCIFGSFSSFLIIIIKIVDSLHIHINIYGINFAIVRRSCSCSFVVVVGCRINTSVVYIFVLWLRPILYELRLLTTILSLYIIVSSIFIYLYNTLFNYISVLYSIL